MTHHITTTGPPPFSRPRRLAPDRCQNAKQEFEHMLSLGIIREFSSNFSSPFTWSLKLMVTGDLAVIIER